MRKSLLLIWLSLLTNFVKAQTADSSKILPDIINLEEVKVSANLPLNNNNVVDFYRTNHFATLDNINARLDGMALIKRGAYAQEPQLNGFSGGQLNVTIDGMKMFGACTDKMDPVTSYIEPTNLKKITINQGTSGCMNGCNIGGSVDMSLQEPNEKSAYPFYSSLGAGYESVSKSRNVLFSTGYSKQKWAFGFDGVYRKNENYTDGNNKIVPFSQFQKTNIHSVLKYVLDNFQSFKVDLLYDDARNVGYPALPMDVGVAKATLVALEYQRSSKIQLKAKLYFNTIKHVMDDSKRDSLYLLTNKPQGKSDTVYMRMDMPGESSTLGAYIQVIIPWNDKNKLTIKADNYTNNSVAEMTMHMRYAGFAPESPMYMQTWPAMLRNVTGIFAQNTTFISEKLLVLLNGRIDYNTDVLQSEYGQQQFSVFNYSLPRKQSKLVKSINLSSQYQFTKSLSTVATIGYSERMPTIGERLGFYLFNAYDGYDYIGNPYLNSEKSNFFRLAFLLSKPKLKVNFSQSLSFLSDYIMGVTDTSIPAMSFYAKGIRLYENIPSAKLYSADLQVLYNPIDVLSVFLSSKFTLGEIDSGEPMPLISPLNSVIAVQYQKGNIKLQAECENSLAQNRINLNYGEHETPSFTVFNIKSGYTIKMNRHAIDASFGVTNILNKAYYAHLDWGRINRPGRSFELFLKYSF
jgi:iron complex outermembrane receptor protein